MIRPRGCDTFVAFPPATARNVVIFGKNSDRPTGEVQTIRRYGAVTYNNSNAQLQCTYITIPQASQTYAVLLSQIDWMWGAEMGANEHGVLIGNEAVWTNEQTPNEPKALLGMDLVRLGLERGRTAREALDVITSLLEQYGQGGPCAQDDATFTYHNSFLIVWYTDAFVLETAGRHWVAQRITSGVRNISNCLSIRQDYDFASAGILRRQNSDDENIDFAATFCTGSVDEEINDPRYCGGKRLLEQHAIKEGGITKDDMVEILQNHSQGICMHGGGFETTSSWVSEITMTSTKKTTDTDTSHDNHQVTARHWVTGKPHPCQSSFEEALVLVSNDVQGS